MSHLKVLAQRFVEDDLSAEDQQNVITEAAAYVKSEGKTHNGNAGAPAMELALSIQRWMSKDDPDDDVGDVEKNAKAHTFVARTLKALPGGTLKAKEVQVFAAFFGSMYSIGGNSWPVATEALTTLASMDNCSGSAVDTILSSMADINPDDFAKQLAKTRLDVLKLFGQLVSGGISEARQKRDSLPKILKLAVRERDPNNLLSWFRTLSSIVCVTQVSDKTATALFESFSPFFPISIRASTSNTKMVSEKDLKDALRSCFAANGQLAQLALPFLLGKLDDGTSSMTASVKLDVLETIKACIFGYEPFDTHVLPYIPQIWASLKYEVRNGEAPEPIQETLSVFEAISERLANDSSSTSLTIFIDTIWHDSIEDLVDNPAYTEQLGSILISVARAHVAAFRLISSRLGHAIQRALKQPKSSAHTKSLLLVLNNLLRVRRQLASSLSAEMSPETNEDASVSPLDSAVFRVFNANIANLSSQEVEVAKEALLVLDQIVKQRRPTADGSGLKTDCAEETSKDICTVLSFHYLNCFNRRAPNAGSPEETLQLAVGDTLLATVQNYPQGYGQIVSEVLDDVRKTNWTGTPAQRSLTALSMSCMRLAYLGCAAVPEDAAAFVNFATFAGGMLKILGGLFASEANFAACAYVVAALLKGVRFFVTAEQVRPHLDVSKKADVSKQSWEISVINDAIRNMLPGFPDLAIGQFDQFDPKALTQHLSDRSRFTEQASVQAFLQLSVFIVRQLYQHATTQADNSGTPTLNISAPLTVIETDGQSSSNSLRWRDRYLNMVGSIAAAVLQELNLSAQKDLVLHKQILACFCLPEESIQHVNWSYHCSAMLTELSWGITNAIRPEVVLSLHGDIDKLLMETKNTGGVASQTQSRITTIATLLANKYDTRSPTSTGEARQEHEVWIQVLSKIEDLLKDPDQLASMPAEKLSTITGILWGAITRGDRFVTKGLQDAIGRAAVKSNDVARLLAKIFSPLERFLCPTFTPAYLVSKPLSGQRAYYHCVRPVLSDAYPVSGESESSVSLAVYVLHSVKQLNVAQYEQDADKIFRIAVTAMAKAKYVEDIDAAATIVHHIISNRTTLAKQYWSTVLDAERAMYNNAHPFQHITPAPAAAGPSDDPWTRNTNTRPETEDDRAELRKKSLRLSGLVAQKLDSPGPQAVQRSRLIADELMHLLTASGDKIREVRGLVLQTRGHWLRIENPSMGGNE